MTNRASSFRDPAGRLHFIGGKPVRQVYADHADAARRLLGGPFFAELMRDGEVVATRVLESAPGELAATLRSGELLLAHETVPFPSFPAEWPREMLHAAASLTLGIARRGLAHGIGLKDATPYNVLFKGPRPVFVDVLSFEERDPCDPVWLAQGQFLRTFLLPLLSSQALKLPLAQLFLTRRDGLEPAELYRMLGPLTRMRPPFLGSVSLPVWLSGRAEASGSAMYRPRRLKSREQSDFVLRSQFSRLSRSVNRAGGARTSATAWSDYCRTCTYDQGAFRQKSAFVEAFLAEHQPARVLDVGCNTGHFSRLAARGGAQVVAIDQDQAVVGGLWREAVRDRLDILPLVVDLARPTPPLGWNNAETPSFLARARGHFDAVLMLALVHHLVVTDQIPLREVMALAARLTTRHLVIEYVPPGDPQFRRLARGRDALYQHLTREHFEATAAEFFRLEKSVRVENQERWLYLMEKI
jgi:SAM-dependent methyltransferase